MHASRAREVVSEGGVPEPLVPDPLVADPFPVAADLAGVGARVRAEWRADEEMWMHEAARRWAHGRRIGDVLREYAARGDRVAIAVAGSSFDGMIDAVGDDRVDVTTGSSVVTIRTALADGFGAIATPLCIRRSYRARAGGRRVPSALVTFVGRLRELEECARPVRVGTFVSAVELTGVVVVGADHATVCGSDEVVVPLAWVAYVVAPSGTGA